MKVTFTCVGCSKTLAVADDYAGCLIRCPSCAEAVRVPARTVAVPQLPRTASRTPNSGASQRGIQNRRRAVQAQSKSRQRIGRRRETQPDSDHDIWGQPLSSYVSPALPPVTRTRQRNRNRKDPGPPRRRGEFTPALIVAGSTVGFAVIASLAEASFPGARAIGLAAGLIVAMAFSLLGGLTILGNAFQESAFCGIACLMCAPYKLYFVVSRWDENRVPFLTVMIGLFCFIGTALVTIGD